MNSVQRSLWAALLLAGGCGLLGWGLYHLLLPARDPVFARIKVEREVAGSLRSGFPIPTGDTEFIRTEMEFIRSELVLGKVVDALALTRQWSDRYGGGKPLGTNDALRRLREVVELLPVKKSGLVDIRVRSEAPAEAVSIANTVAETYRVYQREQCERIKRSISEAVSNSVTTLEEQWRSLGQQIRQAQEQLNATTSRVSSDSLTRLRPAADLPEAPAGAADPAKLQSANELRRQLAELQQARTELEKRFIADTHDAPAVSCVNVDIVRPAVPPLPRRTSSPPGRDAWLAAAGLLLCAGGGLLLKRPRTPLPAPRPAS